MHAAAELAGVAGFGAVAVGLNQAPGRLWDPPRFWPRVVQRRRGAPHRRSIGKCYLAYRNCFLA